MDLEEKQFRSNVITTLHNSRAAKLTFLADRQFKTTILAVTVDLIVADRFFVRAIEFTDTAKYLITALLLIFNTLVIFYLFAKKRSHTDAKKDFKDLDQALYSLIDMTVNTGSKDTMINRMKKCFSDGTRMFCMIIMFALVLAIVALWCNLSRDGGKNMDEKSLGNIPNPCLEGKTLTNVK